VRENLPQNQVLNLYELTKYKAFVAKCDPSILFDFAPNVDLSGVEYGQKLWYLVFELWSVYFQALSDSEHA
jgi:hypothetical protein